MIFFSVELGFDYGFPSILTECLPRLGLELELYAPPPVLLLKIYPKTFWNQKNVLPNQKFPIVSAIFLPFRNLYSFWFPDIASCSRQEFLLRYRCLTLLRPSSSQGDGRRTGGSNISKNTLDGSIGRFSGSKIYR